MARRTTPPPPSGPEKIVDVDVATEMRGSFLEYAYSVIYSRALPDARDGLKPVQRRILFQMAEMGLRPDRGHVKSARVVGEVMGKLHPHGDGAIYDALVRMAQPFSLRLPMVDGHGNFGSPDDGPAAMRYCVTGDTRVWMADGTLPRIDAIVPGLAADTEAVVDLKVQGKDGDPVSVDRVFHSGEHDVLTLTTTSRHSLTGTFNHPVLTLRPVAGVPTLVWSLLSEVRPGDTVVRARAIQAGPGPLGGQDEDVAVLLGAFVSEGFASPRRAGFNNTDADYFERVLDAYDRVVGGQRYVSRRQLPSGKDIHELDVHNLTALRRSPLADIIGSKSAEKSLPEWVFTRSPAFRSVLLQSLFEGDGSFSSLAGSTVQITYSTRSPRLARQVHELLATAGIRSRPAHHASGEIKVVVSNRDDAWAFLTHIGFLGAKQSRAVAAMLDLPQVIKGHSTDRVPYLADFLRTQGGARGPARKWLLKHRLDTIRVWQTAATRSEIVTRLTMTETTEIADRLTDGRFVYDTVDSVRPTGRADVYSLRVLTDDHAFITDGFVSHNTEARLAPPATAMTAGLDEDTVDFAPNYDGRETEPVVLPAAVPNLLVNGAAGIAVGMATNMPPHNLGEVVAAARHLLAHPQATLDDLMRFVPGPDLPTGGMIVGLDGVRDAYETGKGAFRTRATVRVEQVTPRRKGLVVTELPYNVGPEKVVERIKDLVQSKKLQGISAITDLTDGEHGLRLVIEVKNGFHPEALLEQLYKQTPMEDAFNINNVCLVDGQPRTLGLRELLQVFVDHRIDVVRRRSEHRRRKAQDRLHLVEGLLVAILDIDEVIQLIRGSDDAAQARERLMSVFDLTEVQATYILDMPLRRLTKFSRIELETERDDLQRAIADLTDILENDSRLRRVVSDELAEVAATYATPRRTVLLASVGAPATAAVPLEVSDDPCVVLLSTTGLLARTTSDEPLPPDGPRGPHDAIRAAVPATARGDVGLVTSAGRMVRLSVLELPALPPTSGAPQLSGGAPLGAFVDLPAGESVVGLAPLAGPGPTIALGTARGVVKRVVADVPSNRDSWDVIRLDDGDRVVGAVTLSDEAAQQSELVFITSDAQLLRFPAFVVRSQGRAAGGMAGVRLAAGAHVAFFGAVAPGDDAVVVTVAGSSAALPGTVAGSVKVTPFDLYPGKGRGTGGVRCQRFLKGEDLLVVAWTGAGPARASSPSGVPVDLPEPDQRRDASGAPAAAPIGAVAGRVTT